MGAISCGAISWALFHGRYLHRALFHGRYAGCSETVYNLRFLFLTINQTVSASSNFNTNHPRTRLKENDPVKEFVELAVHLLGIHPEVQRPLQIDRGKDGATIQHWLAVPWESPDVILLPGFHTPTENGLKKMKTKGISRMGDELFLTSMGLLGAGSRTLLLSRWRTGGRITADLLKEFIQELPNTSAPDAWQRAVQIVEQTPLNPETEPRVEADPDGPQVTGGHPFFWSSFILIDPGDSMVSPKKKSPQNLAFPDAAGDGE